METEMNDRFKELAEQARKKPMGNSWCYTDPREFEQKFAELVVRECANRLVDMDQQVKGQHNYYRHASLQVMLHFGIQP